MRLIEPELKALRLKALDMADLIIRQLDLLIEAVEKHDLGLAKSIKKTEKKVDKYDVKIDRRCERLIALYQPVADDLRYIIAMMKINSFLEDIGDQINSIGRKLGDMYEAPDEDILTAIRLRELMHKTYSLLQFALESLFNEDLNQSLTALPMDDEIDRLHRESIQVLIRCIQENPKETNDLVQLILLVKGFEKIADHAIHIAQESIFSLDGSVYRHLSSKKLEKLGDVRL